MSTPVTVAVVAVAAVIIGVIGLELPEIRRYLKIRSM
jgi:hypothetical protein